MIRIKSALPSLCSWLGLLVAPQLEAAQVFGRLGAAPVEPAPLALGYSRTRVAMPSAEVRARRADLAVFLKVRDSLPLPESAARWTVDIVGARLVPEVVSCAVDEVVEFTNRERRRVSLVIGEDVPIALEPGASAPHVCRNGGRTTIKVNEMPYLEGSLYVGESVGIAARPDASGRFSINAPKGTYELRVLGTRGVLASREVSLDRTDVDLGQVDLELAASAPTPTPPPTAAPPPSPPPAPEPPSAAHDKVKNTPPSVPAPKPPKLKLEKPESGEAPPKEVAPSPKAKALEPKAKAKAEPKTEPKAEPKAEPKTEPAGEDEAKTNTPRGSEEPPPAKLPTPAPKPKAEKKKAEDDFFELEP